MMLLNEMRKVEDILLLII